MNQVQGVILDIDGTLIDSNNAHAHAWVEALKHYGHNIPYEQVRPLIGMGSDKLLPKVIGVKMDSDEGKKVADKRGEIFHAVHTATLKPFSMVRQLLMRMRDDNLKLAVASSANKEDLERLLELADIGDLIDSKTSSDDAEKSKPDPDIVLAALKLMEIPPENVVMIGDTPYDILAANKAGVEVVAVRCGGWTDDKLKGAIEIYADPADILAHYTQSVLTCNRMEVS